MWYFSQYFTFSVILKTVSFWILNSILPVANDENTLWQDNIVNGTQTLQNIKITLLTDTHTMLISNASSYQSTANTETEFADRPRFIFICTTCWVTFSHALIGGKKRKTQTSLTPCNFSSLFISSFQKSDIHSMLIYISTN